MRRFRLSSGPLPTGRLPAALLAVSAVSSPSLGAAQESPPVEGGFGLESLYRIGAALADENGDGFPDQCSRA